MKGQQDEDKSLHVANCAPEYPDSASRRMYRGLDVEVSHFLLLHLLINSEDWADV